MILIGDKNSSSKQITCKESNSFAPIKIGRSDCTASNVIKILIGDNNGLAKEVYFMPLYDWRGVIKGKLSISGSNSGSNTYNSTIEVIAKYKDDLSFRDSKSAHESVDTFIFNTLYTDHPDYYTATLTHAANSPESFNNIYNMSKYIPYIKYLEFNHDKDIRYYGLCSYNDEFNNIYNNSLYESLEHVVLDERIIYLNNSFTHTPNLKSVFIKNMNMQIGGDITNGISGGKKSFTMYYDGCIILWKKDSIDSTIPLKEGALISTESPVLLVYPCVEDTIYYSDGLLEVNLFEDASITASDYFNNYNSIDEINDIIG